MLLAAILTELPAIRADLSATDGLLATIVGIVSLLSAGGSVLAEKLAEKWNSATVLTFGLALLAVGGVCITLNQGKSTFLIAVGVYGLGVGAVDAAANMQAAALQQRAGKVILSSFFAAWSAGAILGAVIVSIGEGAHLSYRLTIGLTIALVTVAGLVASRFFLRYGHQPHVDLNPVPVIFPWRPVVLLGVSMALFYAVDFGLSNWSPLFLHDVLLASPSTAALGVAVYQIAGLISRLSGDHLTRRFGAPTVVRLACGLATLGMVLTVTTNSIGLAFVGLGLVGLGASVVAPLCFSTVAHIGSEHTLDVLVARLNLFNYAGTIIGGVVIGAVLALTDARVALVIPLICCVGLVMLAKAFRIGVEQK